MKVLAVDFGTSTTVAAVSVDGGPAQLVTLDGSPLMPSAVYLTDSGLLAIGRDADRLARVDPSRYEPNPKRRIDDAEIVLGVAALSVTEVIADVLRHVGKTVREQVGDQLDEVRLTDPARCRAERWARPTEALDRSGVVAPSRPKVLIPEPVAAASHFAAGATGRGVADGQALAVYDLGAGTFDVAILRKTGATWAVLAEAGLPDLGGIDFDRAIIEHIGELRGAERPEEWRRLVEPGDANERRLARSLGDEVKAGKEALSRASSTDIELPEPFRDVHLTRAELEELIRPKLARTIELLTTQVERAGLTPDQLAGIYLVGGSSRIPLIASMVQESTGLIPSTLDQPETSVATGALIATPPADTEANPPAPAPAFMPTPPMGPISQPPAQSPAPPPPATAPRPVAAGHPASHPPSRPQPTPPAPPRGPAAGPGHGGPPPRPTGAPHGATPAKRRRGPMVAGLAALVAAAVAVTLILTLGGDEDPEPNPQGEPSASATSDPSPTASADPSAVATAASADEYDGLLTSDAMIDYLEPIYDDIQSCTKDPADSGFVTCDLGDDKTVIIMDTDTEAYEQDAVPNFVNASDSDAWAPGSYQKTTWTSPEGDHGGTYITATYANTGSPVIYWERDEELAAALGIATGSGTTISPEDLQATWDDLFNH